MTIKIEAPKRGRLAHNQKSKRVAFRCPQNIVEALEQIATDNKVSVSAVIVAALKDFTNEK
jgi:predicted transcriptional regulator